MFTNDAQDRRRVDGIRSTGEGLPLEASAFEEEGVCETFTASKDSVEGQARLDLYANRVCSAEAITRSNTLIRCEELSGLSLFPIDSAANQAKSPSDSELLQALSADFISVLNAEQVVVDYNPRVGAWIYGVRIPECDLTAAGVLCNCPETPPGTPCMDYPSFRYTSPMSTQCPRRDIGIHPDHLRRLLQSAITIVRLEIGEAEQGRHCKAVTEQLSSVYERLSLLNDLPQCLHYRAEPLSVGRRIVQRLAEICDVSYWAFCLNHPIASANIVSDSWESDAANVMEIVRTLQATKRQRPIVTNTFQRTSMSKRFPALTALVAVPLNDRFASDSWIVLANPRTQRELGSEDVTFVRTICFSLAAHLDRLL
jgi:hypothetical protein